MSIRSNSVRVLLGVLSLSAVACNPIYYSPSTQNVPLLAEKGDFAGTLAVGDQRFEGNAAYAFTSRIGAQVNAGKYDPEDLDNGDGGSGDFFEVGVGTFGPLGSRFTWEVYALLAGASFENHRPSSIANNQNPGTTGNISGKVTRFGVQPAIGLRRDHFEGAFSMRVAQISFTDVEGSLRYENVDQVQRLKTNDHYTLIEPALTLRGGLSKVKLQLQLQRSINLTESDFSQDDGALTIGIFARP